MREYLRDKSKQCQLITQSAEETIYEIKEDNQGEQQFRKYRTKIVKLDKDGHHEEWEYLDEQNRLRVKISSRLVKNC